MRTVDGRWRPEFVVNPPTSAEVSMSRTPIGCCLLSRITMLATLIYASAACESQLLPSPTAPGAVVPPLAASQSHERCVNVSAEGTASLGFVTLPNGTSGFGASWSPITLGGLSGEMASVVVSEEISGQGGARHLTLEHAFQLPDGDYFLTHDRAVCAPAGRNPATCHVNDVLTIVDGTGVFANANGSLRNHAEIDFAASALDFSVRGRVCGDGL
jgi:hypothetical protein